MTMPPVIRAIGYWFTFFAGLALTSIGAGYAAVGTGTATADLPTWYKWAIAVFPTWSSAFGLTAATHWKNTGSNSDQDRHPGYKPERALDEEDRILAEAPIEELEDLDLAGTNVLRRNQEPLAEPTESPFFRDDTNPNQPRLEIDPDDLERAQDEK
jgi:hypothetical protein